MKRELSIRMLCLLLLLSVVCSCVGCGEKKEQRDSREIIEELVVDYGSYGQEAEKRVQKALALVKYAPPQRAHGGDIRLYVFADRHITLQVAVYFFSRYAGLYDSFERRSASMPMSSSRLI